MNIKSLLITSTLITSSFAYTMEHNAEPTYIIITDLNTPITFRDHTKSIYNWINNDRNYEFGKTMIASMIPIVNMTPDGPLFEKTGTINNPGPNDLRKIASNRAIYCYNIKKKSYPHYYYGAIICCNESNLLTSEETIKNIVNNFKYFNLLRLYSKDKKSKESGHFEAV